MYELISRAEAIEKGLTRYYTGVECKYGHINFRKASNGVCVECARLTTKNWRNNGKKQEMYPAKVMPTVEYLQECFDIIDNQLVWKQRPENHFYSKRSFKQFSGRYSGKVAGHRNKRHKYLEVRLDGKLYKGHRIIYKMLTGKEPSLIIDHIDGDVTNDNLSNLREANSQENARNSTKRTKNGTSKYKGVFLDENGLWSSVITVNDVGIVEYANSEHEAAKSYNKKATEMFGEFAKLNDLTA